MHQGKVRAFLDTSVILQALKNDRIARTLFTPDVEERVTYYVDPVVLQEMLLASSTQETRLRADELLQHLQVTNTEGGTLRQDELHDIKKIRNRLVHANDLLILNTARDYDVLLTYDSALRAMGRAEGITTRTPEDFLAEFGVQS